jgi:hypothetical protein
MDCITEGTLTFDALSRLVNGSAMALRIPDFADRSTCDHLAAWFTSHTGRQPYTHEIRRDGGVEHKYFGVDRLGNPFNRVLNTAQNSPERLSYYADALPNIRRVREAVRPHLSPMDKLRLELDEVWPGGATLARFEGRTMFFGIGRIMDPDTSKDSELNPHIDVLPKSSFDLSAQFSANVYLAVPPSGGELEMWNGLGKTASPSDRPANPPTVTIQPRPGELVIFNTWRLHAISRFNKGVRASIQGFIGYTAFDHPLLLWD